MNKNLERSEKRALPRFIVEGLAKYENNDKYFGAIIGLIDNAPQWAYDEYLEWLEILPKAGDERV